VDLTLRWPAAHVCGSIAAEEIHLWAWSLDPIPQELTPHVKILDHTELQRMRAFHFAEDRARYMLTHANLRRILGAYLHRSPEHIHFAVNRFGKPQLSGEDASCLQFSLSHSRTIAVLAVTPDEEIGVDVEDVRPIEPEVAAAHFSAAELSDLCRLHGDAWLGGFYRCWTRKEAILKAEGVGLQRALDGFDVSLLPNAPAELLGARGDFLRPWKLHDVSPAPETIGALATLQTKAQLTCRSFLS
jgi:4'-phosphopantetheinyl transferase